MVNVAKKGKRLVVVGIATAAVAALLIAPTAANALFYVHNEDDVENSEATGAMEVCITLDASAVGGSVHAGMFFIPDGGTVQDCLETMILDSNDQNGITALHDYSYASLEEVLTGEGEDADADEDTEEGELTDIGFLQDAVDSGSGYTIRLYEAASQEPGTQTTYDTEGTEVSLEDTVERYDSVVFTVTK